MYSYSLLKIYFLFLVGIGSLSCVSCQKKIQKPTNPQLIFQIKDKSIQLKLQLACTPQEQAQGLMYVKKLPEGEGMLFVFPYARVQSFWMKNVSIPLDMIHLNEKKEVVGIVENAKPYDESSRIIGKESLYVLEVNAFFARKNGIEVGDKAQFIHEPFCP